MNLIYAHLFNILSLLISAFSSWLILKIIIPYLRNFLSKKPDRRSSHIKETPSGGGISICLVSITGCFLYGNYLPFFCLPLALIGLVDDRLNLPVKTRFLFQLLTVLFLWRVFFINNFYLGDIFFINKLLLMIFIIFCSLSIINFSNFMDGIDGIVASSFSLIFLFTFFLNGLDLIPVIGALFGFLLWNWEPAKVFMGDIGSTFLGSIFVGVLMQSSLTEIISLVLISSPLMLDAIFCIFRRILYKEKIFKAHRLHLYQRLCQAGWSHSLVTMNYLLSILLIAIAWFLGGLPSQLFASLIILFYGFWLDKNKAVPYKNN